MMMAFAVSDEENNLENIKLWTQGLHGIGIVSLRLIELTLYLA